MGALWLCAPSQTKRNETGGKEKEKKQQSSRDAPPQGTHYFPIILLNKGAMFKLMALWLGAND